MRSARAKRKQGTVSVEIVVMLPVFVLLFLGVYHVHRLAQTRLATQQAARACAWELVMNGCVPVKDSKLCTGVVQENGPRVETINTTRAPDVRVQEVNHNSSGVFAAVEKVPLIGSVVRLVFGTSAAAHSSASVPGFLSPQSKVVKGSTFLVCNTISESWEDKVKGTLCSTAKALGLDELDMFKECKE